MGHVREATDETFEELVLRSNKPVIVDFWATWCGPCRMVAPEVERLAGKYAGSVEVVKVDVDANPTTAGRYGVMSIPTIAYFEPGAAPRTAIGFRPAEELELEFGLADLAKTA